MRYKPGYPKQWRHKRKKIEYYQSEPGGPIMESKDGFAPVFSDVKLKDLETMKIYEEVQEDD